jgi:hypothetical protein
MRKNLALKIFAVLSFTIVAFAQDSSWGEKGFQYLMKGKYLPSLVVTSCTIACRGAFDGG